MLDWAILKNSAGSGGDGPFLNGSFEDSILICSFLRGLDGHSQVKVIIWNNLPSDGKTLEIWRHSKQIIYVM